MRVALSALLALGIFIGAASPAWAEARLLALGDSLTAGYGLDEAQGFVPQLEAALRERGHEVTVVNAGVSGDTASGGAARLDWTLGDETFDGAIVELGANDGLRGLDPAVTREALAQILDTLEARGIPVVFAGMFAPPNMGEDYGAAFNAIYPDLARERDVVFYPFFLQGVAADASLNQADGIHPNAAGVAVIVDNILPSVEALLETDEPTDG